MNGGIVQNNVECVDLAGYCCECVPDGILIAHVTWVAVQALRVSLL